MKKFRIVVEVFIKEYSLEGAEEDGKWLCDELKETDVCFDEVNVVSVEETG